MNKYIVFLNENVSEGHGYVTVKADGFTLDRGILSFFVYIGDSAGQKDFVAAFNWQNISGYRREIV